MLQRDLCKNDATLEPFGAFVGPVAGRANALQAQDPRTALTLLKRLAILVPMTPGPTTACEVREERNMQIKTKGMMRQVEEQMIRLRMP